MEKKVIKIDNFKIPTKSTKYILLQRTSYQSRINGIFRKLRIGSIYDKYMLASLERFRKKKIKEKYFNDLQNDYLEIQKYLPKKVENILDIGCGMAGIDIFLYNHYFNPNLFLLDKEGVSKIYYGFQEEGAYYNSFNLAKDFLKINGVIEDKIEVVNITTSLFPQSQNFDLVISLISWGFHYPVETYLDDVYESLTSEGVLIIDVRKNTDGKKELERKFRYVSVISKHKKHERLACKK